MGLRFLCLSGYEEGGENEGKEKVHCMTSFGL